MEIGICHFRVGGLDGVSLEIAKWKQVLEGLGHRVHLCAGRLGGEEGFRIPELDPEHPEVRRILENAFIRLDGFSEEGLERAIAELSARIETQLERFIVHHALDLLIVENIWSLPANPAAALALYETVRRLGLSAIAHHHDFYWEKPLYRPTCGTIERLLRGLFPPKNRQIKHVVLNSLAQARLRREGIAAEVVPNVFDFDAPPWQADEGTREAIGVSAEDLLVLQATRLIRRKGVELALDFVAEMNAQLPAYRGRTLYDGRKIGPTSRAVLLLSNRPESGYLEAGYYEKLREKAAHTDVPVRFADTRGQALFWAAYALADLVVYPTLQEGWGNQLLEAVFARKPLVIFEYEVFRRDIAPRGFRFISLGREFDRGGDGLARLPTAVLRRAAREALEVLTAASTYRESVEHNFRLGARYYSLSRLHLQMEALLGSFTRRVV